MVDTLPAQSYNAPKKGEGEMIKWVGIGLMVISALVGVLAYQTPQVLIGSGIFFIIGLIIFAK